MDQLYGSRSIDNRGFHKSTKFALLIYMQFSSVFPKYDVSKYKIISVCHTGLHLKIVDIFGPEPF